MKWLYALIGVTAIAVLLALTLQSARMNTAAPKQALRYDHVLTCAECRAAGQPAYIYRTQARNELQCHLWRYMTDRKDCKPGDPLFASRTNTRLDRTNLRHMLNTVARQAKVTNVHPHRFRHTFAITFLRNGGNSFALQKLLGHSELSTVLKYVRLAETDIKAAQAAASVVDNWRL